MARIIGTAEAAEKKDCSRNAILDAIRRGVIDSERLGPRSYAVKANRKFEEWEPNRKRQKIGRQSQKPKQRAKKAKKPAKKAKRTR